MLVRTDLRTAVLAGLAGVLAAAQASAHPGHGAEGGFSLAHYMTEPLHVVTAALCVVAVAGALAWASRRARSRDL